MHPFLTLLVLLLCSSESSEPTRAEKFPTRIGEILLPEGFKRMIVSKNSFGYWLRNIPLKKEATVYLYDGRRKNNQSAQFAVLDVAVGNKDLQQCADAVIRLRAEYLLSVGAMEQIAFHATDGTLIDYASWMIGYRFIYSNNRLQKRKLGVVGHSRSSFEQYLETVFSYAGTLSLSHELHVKSINSLIPGDVFVQGGSPGHAVIVADVAVNAAGQKKFLLAQSYMPAQDIHLLRNPLDPGASVAWYSIPSTQKMYTPEWVFSIKGIGRFAEF